MLGMPGDGQLWTLRTGFGRWMVVSVQIAFLRLRAVLHAVPTPHPKSTTQNDDAWKRESFNGGFNV